jgi:ubiquinone/menaquinone biosynthesis C-methylase UbiE
MCKEAFRFTGNDAACYEQYLGPLIFEPSAVEFLSHLVALPAQAILETSCGTGRLTRHLRQDFPPDTQITATDISADMLALAQGQLGNSNIYFKVADAQELPFADEYFNLVVNQYGLMFFPDKQRGFDETFRVLKPGGYFVFATWDRTDAIPLFKLVIDDMVIPFFKGEDTSRFYMPFSLHDPQQLLGFLKQTGFKHNKVMHVVFTGHTDSPMNIVNGLFLKHPLGREVKEKDPAAYNHIAAEMEHRIIERFGPGPFEFELKALIGIGQK